MVIIVIAGLVVCGIFALLCVTANMNSSHVSENYGPYEQPIKTK